MSFLSNLGSILSDSAKAVSNWIPGSGVIINPIAGVIDNAINKYESQKATDRAYNFQQSMLDQQQDFNAEQSQLNRDFQAEQSSIQNEFNASEAQKAREWNSEQNVLARQLSAGINPLAGDMSLGSSFAAQSAGLPSGSEAQSGLIGAPSSAINPFLMAANIRSANAVAAGAEYDLDLKRKREPYVIQGDKLRLASLGEEIEHSKQDRKLLSARCDAVSKSIDVMEQNILTSKALSSLYDKNGQLEQKRIDSYADELASRLSKEKSETNLYVANAKEAYSKVFLNGALARQANASAQLAEDSHVLNGVQLQLVNDNKEMLVNIAWDEKVQQYGITLDNRELSRLRLAVSRATGDAEKAKAEKELRLYMQRNVPSLYNSALDGIENFCNSVGIKGSDVLKAGQSAFSTAGAFMIGSGM